MGRLFGTDGIRGVYGEELTDELATRVGLALTNLFLSRSRTPKILVGRDTRISSPPLAQSLCRGVCLGGGDAFDIGVCSTPAVAYLLKKHRLDFGVMISASHNPYNYNGIKIFGPDGFKLSDADEERIEEMILSGDLEKVTVSEERILTIPYARDEYIEHLSGAFETSLSGMRIGIDCANGSASATAKELFCRLGAECYVISDDPNGYNINEDCGSTHLDSLKRLVIKSGLDLGVAFDGDADRCLAVDRLGHEIDGDVIIAMLSLWLKERGELDKNTVVGTVMSNMGLKKFCDKNGIDYLSTKVGDRYVLELLNQEGYSFGGEQSGHIIFRRIATTGDGQLTALALASYVKEKGKDLSALAEVFKKYPQYMINLPASESDKKALSKDKKLKHIISLAKIEMGDDGRIVIRPSGTEPLIRIMAEGCSRDLTRSACLELAEKIKNRLCELNGSVG